MAAVTPDEWLPILAKRLDERQPRIALLRSYANGNAPMPEMGRNLRPAWEAFQKKARGGFGSLICTAVGNRMVMNGVTVGGGSDSPAAQAAVRIVRDNRFDVAFADAINDAFETSIGYLLVGEEDGKAVVTRELPEFMYAATDPLRPWRARAAIKVWRDVDADADFALVWADGVRQKYRRQSHDLTTSTLLRSAQGGWSYAADPETYDGPPPVAVLENRDGLGEFEKHTDLLDRINLGVLNRMVVVAMQAFRQRAIEGGLPDKDAAGNPIDWAKVFEPSPGALWDLPEGLKIWESQDASAAITSILLTVKDDLRDLSAVSETPLAMLVPDGANQSATGADFQKEAVVFKARDRLRRFSPAGEMALVRALRVEGVDLADATVAILWEPPDRVSLAEKYDAAGKAKAAGESWKSIARNILGYSPDQIRQDELDRAEEQLAAATLTAAVTPRAPVTSGIPANA